MPKDVGDMLFEDGVIDSITIQAARDRAELKKIPIDTSLLEISAVDINTLWGYLSKLSGLPRPQEEWLKNPSPDAIKVFNSDQAGKYKIVPLKKEGRNLSVIVSYPIDLQAVDNATFIASCFLKLYIAPSKVLKSMLKEFYGVGRDEKEEDDIEELGDEPMESPEDAWLKERSARPPNDFAVTVPDPQAGIMTDPVAPKLKDQVADAVRPISSSLPGQPEKEPPVEKIIPREQESVPSAKVPPLPLSPFLENVPNDRDVTSDYSDLIRRLAAGDIVIQESQIEASREKEKIKEEPLAEEREKEFAPTIPDAPKESATTGAFLPSLEEYPTEKPRIPSSSPESVKPAATTEKPESSDAEPYAEVGEEAKKVPSISSLQPPPSADEPGTEEDKPEQDVWSNIIRSKTLDKLPVVPPASVEPPENPTAPKEKESSSPKHIPIPIEDPSHNRTINIDDKDDFDSTPTSSIYKKPISDEVVEEAVLQMIDSTSYSGYREPPQKRRPVSLMFSLKQLESVDDRDALVANALHFFTSRLPFAICFVVSHKEARFWDALGIDADKSKLKELKLSLSDDSAFKIAFETGNDYLGIVRSTEVERAFYTTLNITPPPNVLILPIKAGNKVVMLFYVDGRDKTLSAADISDIMVYTNFFSGALERIISRRKRFGGVEKPATGEIKKPAEEAAKQPPPLKEKPPAQPPQEPLAVGGQPKIPEKEAEPARKAEELIHRPQSFPTPAPTPSEPLRLAVPSLEKPEKKDEASAEKLSPEQVSQLIIEILRQPEAHLTPSYKKIIKNFKAALPIIIDLFPGPLVIDPYTQDLYEIPNVEEHGIVLRMLVDIGKPAILHILPLLTSPDVTIRRYAVYLFSKIYSPHILPDITQRLFDRDPKTRILASEVLKKYRWKPEFAAVIKILENALSAEHPEKVRVAAINLGRFRAEETIENLVEMLDNEREPIREAAAEALREICKQDFGINKGRWKKWHKQNADKPRVAWLIEGLFHKNEDIRFTSNEELLEITKRDFGFYYSAPKKERDIAAKKWKEWYEEEYEGKG
ncbi:MAG: hypothetical protein Kow0090_19130 [Myxococcota bacterium]